jgi:hypothetical protein
MKRYAGSERHPITLVLNGVQRSAWCEPRRLLSDF